MRRTVFGTGMQPNLAKSQLEGACIGQGGQGVNMFGQSTLLLSLVEKVDGLGATAACFTTTYLFHHPYTLNQLQYSGMQVQAVLEAAPSPHHTESLVVQAKLESAPPPLFTKSPTR